MPSVRLVTLGGLLCHGFTQAQVKSSHFWFVTLKGIVRENVRPKLFDYIAASAVYTGTRGSSFIITKNVLHKYDDS